MKYGTYCPASYGKAWVCWDLDNGHSNSKGYLWVFPTRNEALTHRKQQHKEKFGARLSPPMRISFEQKS